MNLLIKFLRKSIQATKELLVSKGANSLAYERGNIKSGIQVMTMLGDLAKMELSTIAMVTPNHQMPSLADRILEIRDEEIVKETEII